MSQVTILAGKEGCLAASEDRRDLVRVTREMGREILGAFRAQQDCPSAVRDAANQLYDAVAKVVVDPKNQEVLDKMEPQPRPPVDPGARIAFWSPAFWSPPPETEEQGEVAAGRTGEGQARDKELAQEDGLRAGSDGDSDLDSGNHGPPSSSPRAVAQSSSMSLNTAELDDAAELLSAFDDLLPQELLEPTPRPPSTIGSASGAAVAIPSTTAGAKGTPSSQPRPHSPPRASPPAALANGSPLSLAKHKAAEAEAAAQAAQAAVKAAEEEKERVLAAKKAAEEAETRAAAERAQKRAAAEEVAGAQKSVHVALVQVARLAKECKDAQRTLSAKQADLSAAAADALAAMDRLDVLPGSNSSSDAAKLSLSALMDAIDHK